MNQLLRDIALDLDIGKIRCRQIDIGKRHAVHVATVNRRHVLELANVIDRSPPIHERRRVRRITGRLITAKQRRGIELHKRHAGKQPLRIRNLDFLNERAERMGDEMNSILLD